MLSPCDLGCGPKIGDGWSSIILWNDQLDLFVFDWPQPVAFLTVADLCVSSVTSAKMASNTAFKFTAGVVKSSFTHLLFYGAGGIPNTNINTFFLGTCIDMGVVSDTNVVR